MHAMVLKSNAIHAAPKLLGNIYFEKVFADVLPWSKTMLI